MTHLQKLIRDTVDKEGAMQIRVGRTSPCTMGTVRALQRAGYSCIRVGYSGLVSLYQVYKPKA